MSTVRTNSMSSVTQTHVLDNGIKLGGVFSDFHEKILHLGEMNRSLTETCAMLEEDRLALYIDREIVRIRWLSTARDLSLKTDDNSQLNDVFEQIRSDRNDLEAFNRRLHSDLSRYQARNEELTKSLDCVETFNAVLQERISELSYVSATEIEENKSLRDIIYTKDEQLQSLSKQSSDKSNEIEILTRSLQAKDKQLASIVKDRDRLRSLLTAATNALLPKQRTALGSPPSTTSRPSTYSSPKGISGLSSGTSTPASPMSSSKAHKPVAVHDDLDNFGSFISTSETFDVRKRQYESVIRNLRKEIMSLKSSSASVKTSK